jgi:virginiamycin B lyase
MVGPGREGDDMAKHTKSGAPGRAGKGRGRVSATVALSGTGTGLGGAPPGRLYWSGDDIWAANLDGTNPQDLLPAFEPTIGVAVDSSHVYWINTNTNAVRRADPDGSNPQDLVPGQLALADSGLAVDASHLYWTNFNDGTIRQANLDGSNPQVIVTGQATPFGIAVDASHLYWTNEGDGTIWRANLDGTNAQSIVQGEGQTSLFAVAVDATHLYWTNRSQGTVKRADLDGINPQTLLGGQNQPQAIAVDGNFVYWSILGDQNGEISRANLVDGTNPQVFIASTFGAQLLAFTPPALGFTPSSYDFGEVRTREAASQSFTLANSGGRATGPLTVTVAGSAAFTTTGDTCTGTSLAQGASCTVTVSFGPTSFGAVTATLTGASQNPAVSATAALTGTGVGHLYWINEGQTATDGSINLANPDGSNAVTLTSPAGALPFPQGVAVNANLLYVSVRGDLDNDPEFEPFILSAENDNLDSYSRLFVFQTSGQDGQVPQQLAIDANNPNDLFWKSGDGRIWRGNINNETFQNIFPQQPPQARGMTVDANYVYWSTFRALQGDGTIWRANLDGTNPVQLAQNQDAPQGLAVDANHLYWTNTGGGTIMRANLDGALPQPIVANQDVPVGVAVDATHLYWTNVGNPEVADGSIWRANLDGTNPQQIISGQNNPVAIAIGS